MKPLPGKDGCEWGSVYLHQMLSFQRRRWKQRMSRGFLILDNAVDLWTRPLHLSASFEMRRCVPSQNVVYSEFCIYVCIIFPPQPTSQSC